MRKPESVDEAKEWLKEVADYLEKVPHASSRLLFASNAIRSYLNGESKSLNHAFRLVRSSGGQKRTSKNRELALVASKKRRNGMPWKKICDELNFYDERELRRIVEQNHAEIIEIVSKEIMDEIMDEGV